METSGEEEGAGGDEWKEKWSENEGVRGEKVHVRDKTVVEGRWASERAHESQQRSPGRCVFGGRGGWMGDICAAHGHP